MLANPDPKTTLLKLTPKEALDANDRAKVARIKAKGSGVKINFALAELPDFKTLPGKSVGPQHSGGHHDRSLARLLRSGLAGGAARRAGHPPLQPDDHPVGDRSYRRA